MARNRKEVERFITESIDAIIPDGENKRLYDRFFSRLSDRQFDTFMRDLEEGKTHLSIIVPNYSKKGDLSLERNFKVAKKLGVKFFQKLWIGPKEDEPRYKTPVEYMVIDLPFRRLAQLLVKKISIPEDNKHIDELTFQPTGKSKASKISYPELQVLTALDLDNSIVELLKYRGGDKRGWMALNILIDRQGGVRQSVLEPYSSGVESTKVLKTYLTAMHLRSTL